jgi:hypothetical protein
MALEGLRGDLEQAGLTDESLCPQPLRAALPEHRGEDAEGFLLGAAQFRPELAALVGSLERPLQGTARGAIDSEHSTSRSDGLQE